MVRLIFSCFLSVVYFLNYAQKPGDPLQIEYSRLKELFKEDEIAALSATSLYNFSTDQQNGTLTVKNHESYRYLALKANASLVIRNYYNDKSYIESYSLKSDKGKSYPHSKFCGHYQQGDVFYSDAQVCSYSLTMEQPAQTSLFESTVVYKDAKYVTYAFFHGSVPAMKRELVVTIPDWASIELVEMNFNSFEIKKNVTKQNGFTSHEYTIENLESFPDDKDTPGHLLFLPHVLILTKFFQFQGKQVSVLSSTDDLYKWYTSLTSKIKKNGDSLKPIVNNLVTGLTTSEEKIKAIYYWVQDNIKYIAFEDGLAAFKPEDASEVFYKRYGDCKGMANLTKDMLMLAGFDARLTWIGTDRIPYTYAVPSLAVNNHMICTVFDNNKRYVLDATEKYNSFGTHAERIQGKEILIEDGTSYIIGQVPEEKLENYLQESSWQYEISGNALKGSGKERINGEYKKILLNVVSRVKKEDIDKLLKNIVSGDANRDNFTLKTHSNFNRDEELNISYDMTLENQVYQNDKELYVGLDFSNDFKKSKLEKNRKVPYKFDSKAFRKVKAELTIPSGYALGYLPESYHAASNNFVFDMNYKLVGNKVIYTKEIKILKSILPVSEFDNWNNAVEGLNKFYNDQIILKAK